jgi:hypothetical protein
VLKHSKPKAIPRRLLMVGSTPELIVWSGSGSRLYRYERTEKDRLLTESLSMVARDYLVKNFKLQDTKIKTIGLGKSEKAPEGGAVEIVVCPEGTTAAQNSASCVSR